MEMALWKHVWVWFDTTIEVLYCEIDSVTEERVKLEFVVEENYWKYKEADGH